MSAISCWSGTTPTTSASVSGVARTMIMNRMSRSLGLLHRHDEARPAKSTRRPGALHETGAERPDFHCRPLAGGAAGGNGERFLTAVAIEQEEAADHLLGLGERPV